MLLALTRKPGPLFKVGFKWQLRLRRGSVKGPAPRNKRSRARPNGRGLNRPTL